MKNLLKANYKLMTLVCLSCFLFSSQTVFCESQELGLSETLSSIASKSSTKISAKQKEVMLESQKKLSLIDFESKTLAVGKKFPSISLLDHKGEYVDVKSASNSKKVVVVFYRGEWCPFCNAHLLHLQKSLPDLKASGAEVIAISPDKPEFALSVKSKNKLGMKVFSDPKNKLAKELGIVFELGEDLKSVYSDFGIDLKKSHGTDKWELPLAATFVLDENLTIKWRFLDIDYKKRADSEDIIEALKSF